jgi:hypothetical protein
MMSFGHSFGFEIFLDFFGFGKISNGVLIFGEWIFG